jgi:ComF family protein
MRQYIFPMPALPAARLLPRLCTRASAVVRRVAQGRCAVCRGWCEGGLCACCEARFAVPCPRCAGCALPLAPVGGAPLPCVRCRFAPPPWSHVTAGVDYGHPWDRLLADLKFHERPERAGVLLGPLLARLRDEALPEELRIVPVPLARERLRERGYNQSWELARRLARALGREARAEALFRVRDTGHQLGLRREQRAANLHGAFVAAPAHAAWLRGARIALVDDVLTTGATARAATRTLLAAGAREVRLWVVARTPAA